LYSCSYICSYFTYCTLAHTFDTTHYSACYSVNRRSHSPSSARSAAAAAAARLHAAASGSTAGAAVGAGSGTEAAGADAVQQTAVGASAVCAVSDDNGNKDQKEEGK